MYTQMEREKYYCLFLLQECQSDKRKLVYEDQFWLHPPVTHLKATCKFIFLSQLLCVLHTNQLCPLMQALYDFQFGIHSVPAACALCNIFQDIWDDKLR